MSNIKAIRDRAWHYLDPTTAALAGLTLAQLQQFVAGTFSLTPEQLAALAARMGVDHEH